MRFISLENCEEGMTIGKNIYGKNAILLLRYGTKVKPAHLQTLKRLGYPGIYIEDELSLGIDIEPTVNEVTRNNASKAVQDLFTSKFNGTITHDAVIKEIEGILGDIVAQITQGSDAAANLAALKIFDSYTYQHCVDVGVLSIILGREIGMTKSSLIELGKAAFFHDLGKMFILKSILNKPARLTPEEFDEIKTHPVLGHDTLLGDLRQSQRIAEGALYHHERYDGSGYPNGIAGDKIPLFAKIIAVADVYDAITTERAYKRALIANEAYEFVMANSGTHFCPEVVKVFVRKIPPFTVGTGVILSTNALAVVVQNKPNFMTRPLVKLIKQNIFDEDIYIDLTEDADARSITIVGTM